MRGRRIHIGNIGLGWKWGTSKSTGWAWLNTIVTHSPYTKRPKGAKILGACPMFNRTPGEFAEITPFRFLKLGWVKTYYCISFSGMNTQLPANSFFFKVPGFWPIATMQWLFVNCDLLPPFFWDVQSMLLMTLPRKPLMLPCTSGAMGPRLTRGAGAPPPGWRPTVKGQTIHQDLSTKFHFFSEENISQRKHIDILLELIWLLLLPSSLIAFEAVWFYSKLDFSNGLTS